MGLFILFIVTMGYVFGRATGETTAWFVIALLLATGTSFFSYYYSDQVVLALTNAHPADRNMYFDFYTAVENLCIATGLPKPKIYVIDDDAPNAFATGRDPEHAVIVATTGLLKKLQKLELEGVIAHELSHIKNYDIRLMTIIVVLVGFVSILANWFFRFRMWGGSNREERDRSSGVFILVGVVFAIFMPIVATLMQLAVSRHREYLADASGALITRYPDGLASALEKIAQDPSKMRVVNPATAHLFIASPLKKTDKNLIFQGLFDTHPPVEDRIKRLRSM
ncbi:MAG TPA: M48 family metallopeptidase [Patescibacteria group bacterium]|nr:M48 family metallopeptidase [Patescibacteria group bacterium]